jgi:vacuolar-type H+-ATPase subunit C/Vma6
MAASYEYSVGSVRAKEKNLLSRQDIEQLPGAKSTGELCALLRDKGYGGSSDGGDVDALLRDETAALWSYLRGIAPDFSAFDCFLYRNDLHNIKVAIKGTLRGRKFGALMLSPCTIPHKTVESACAERRFGEFPDWAAEAADRAYSILAESGDTPLADAVMDTAAMKAMLNASDRLKSPTLTEYFHNLVFWNNVKVALRAAKTGKNAGFIENAVCPIEGIELREWQRAILAGEDETVALLEKLSIFDCDKGVEQYKLSPSAFEKWVDDRLIRLASECRRVSIGVEPMMGYLLAREAEIKTIHIIASGIRAGQDEQTIRERMREIYG